MQDTEIDKISLQYTPTESMVEKCTGGLENGTEGLEARESVLQKSVTRLRNLQCRTDRSESENPRDGTSGWRTHAKRLTDLQ